MNGIVYNSLDIFQRVKNLNFIKWLFYIMVLSELSCVVFYIGYADYLENMYANHLENINHSLLSKEVAHYFHQMMGISGWIAILVECLLVILYPVAKITKKFIFPKLYFFVPLVLLLIKFFLLAHIMLCDD